MGQITATRNLVATKVVRHAGQQRQLQDETRNNKVLVFGVTYIMDLTILN